jgi:hypothetical protein
MPADFGTTSSARLSFNARFVYVGINPDNPLGRKPIVGASLLAKIFDIFASKLAPTGCGIANG